MENDISPEFSRIPHLGSRIPHPYQFIPIKEFINELAGIDERLGVFLSKKNNVATRKGLFQDSCHWQGEDHITEVIGPADEDAFHPLMALTPGSSFPSMYSSMAPPPVET